MAADFQFCPKGHSMISFAESLQMSVYPSFRTIRQSGQMVAPQILGVPAKKPVFAAETIAPQPLSSPSPTYLPTLNSNGVIPVSRWKYFEKNEGLGKCISSEICATLFPVWCSSTLMRVMSARSIHSLAVTPLA